MVIPENADGNTTGLKLIMMAGLVPIHSQIHAVLAELFQLQWSYK
jgi:hypothetical protein